MSDMNDKIAQDLQKQLEIELEKKGLNGKVVIDKVVAKGTILAIKQLAQKLAPKMGMELAAKEATRITAKSITRTVSKKSVGKFLAKQGVKLTGKVGGKLIPGVNLVLFAMDAVPEAIEEQTKVTKRQWKEAKQASQEWKAGNRKAAVRRFATSGLRGMVEAPVVFGKAALAGFTAKELSDLIPDLPDNFLAYEEAKKNPQGTPYLLALMLALRTAYQYAHWNTKNYQDHLLYERLYLSLDADIDKLAELTVSARNHVNMTDVAVEPDQLEEAERTVLSMVDHILREERPSKGMENFLLTLYENREQALYLLRLRTSA